VEAGALDENMVFTLEGMLTRSIGLFWNAYPQIEDKVVGKSTDFRLLQFSKAW
jgi:hypothetical protein